MFSVKTENILLNYFVVLFTVGMLSVYTLSIFYSFLFLLLFVSGLFFYFEKYFFFKSLFLLGIFLSVALLQTLPNLNILIILILFISFSQISLLLSYLSLFVFLTFHFGFLEFFLIASIFLLTLIFSFSFGLKTITKEVSKKLFAYELRHSIFIHNLCNLCGILFMKNKDRSLEPILNKMRSNLHPGGSSSESSVAGLLRKTIYLLNCDYNLRVKQNFFLIGDDLSWICFFCNLLEDFAKKGSTITVKDNSVFVVLKKDRRVELKKFLSNQFVQDSVLIEKDILKFTYGR